MQLYISMAAEVYFYFSNAHTLGVGFGRNLLSPGALVTRRRMTGEVIIGYLTNKSASKGGNFAAAVAIDGRVGPSKDRR